MMHLSFLLSMKSCLFYLLSFAPTQHCWKDCCLQQFTFVLVETSKCVMIFVKFAFGGLFKLILFLVSSLVQLSLVMRTTKNFQLVTVLISSITEKMFTFSTVFITLHYISFPQLQINTHTVTAVFDSFCHSIMSSLASTDRVFLSVCVTVFIFHVTFPIPVTISPTPTVF